MTERIVAKAQFYMEREHRTEQTYTGREGHRTRTYFLDYGTIRGGGTVHSNLGYLVRFQTWVGTPHKVLAQLGWGHCTTLIGLEYQSKLTVGWLAVSVSDYIPTVWLPFAS